jgi:hypothetical protein
VQSLDDPLHLKFGELRQAEALLQEAKEYDAAIGFRRGLRVIRRTKESHYRSGRAITEASM